MHCFIINYLISISYNYRKSRATWLVLGNYRLQIFQEFCEHAFLGPHHGWIIMSTHCTFGPITAKPILSLIYPTWQMSVLMSFFGLFLECFCIEKFRETEQDAILNLLKGKDVLVSQPTASWKFLIFQSFTPQHQFCIDKSDLLVVIWLPLWSTRLCCTEPDPILL